MDAMRLESYSKALAEKFKDDTDTIATLGALVVSARAEYEPKIPELGNLLGMVRERRGTRLEAQEKALRDAEWAAHLKKWEEQPPEDKYTLADLVAEYQQKRTKVEGQ